jgi:hypothetical protein
MLIIVVVTISTKAATITILIKKRERIFECDLIRGGLKVVLLSYKSVVP